MVFTIEPSLNFKGWGSIRHSDTVLVLENGCEVKAAVKNATAKTAPSILTSGLSFFAACIGVAVIAKMDLMKSLCMLISRGAVISMIAILVVLPVLLLIFHKIIAKTTKGWPSATAKS